MKPALATMIILTAILALAVGSFAMVNMGPGNHTNCLAAIPGSPKCVGGMDPLQFAITHIGALLGASLGVVGPLAVLLFALCIVLAWFALPGTSDQILAFSGRSHIFSQAKTSGTRKRRHWISLLEKRDPSPFCALNA